MRRGSLALVLALAGCTAAPAGPAWAMRAGQADEAGLWMASVTALLVVPGNLDPRDTPAHTALDAGMNAYDPFSPNDCVAVDILGPTITYALDDCSGSFGLVHATGHFTVTYQQTPDGRTQFHASSTDLVMNGGALSFDADASVVHDETMGLRTIDVTAQTHGVGPEGTTFTRHGTQTARWLDSWGCLLVDASDDMLSMVDGTNWRMQASGLTYCVGECPMAGGNVTWTGAEGVLQLSYGGLNSADWTVRGQPDHGTLPISCND